MIEDITPADVSPLIKFDHSNSPDCLVCRQPDRLKKSQGRLYYKIKEIHAELDALAAHCQHPQTQTILMQHYVENEWGAALEQEDVEQCVGCGKVLWGES